MDALVVALAPALALGFAVQRLGDILDPLLSLIPGGTAMKKAVIAVAAFALAAASASTLDIRVLRALGASGNDTVDLFLTALIASAGTEGINSILKWMSYKKEEQKMAAAARAAAVP